ncbi:MAG TPA: hypothetical protein VL326_18660 [Kofleriaceae bacterium]|nr:hypothetical protein [Kofleriaceae bacterium]
MARRSARARSHPAIEEAAVTWREGVHLTGTPIWCDARRRRDVCFASSADRVGKTGHGKLIGTPITVALAGQEDAGHLAVPPHRPFTLGTLRLELIPSGRCFGAAALHVDTGERTILYAAEVRTKYGAEPAEVRRCDALVVAAPYGEVHHRFAKRDDVLDMLVQWIERMMKGHKAPDLVVDNALDGLEVASFLSERDFVVVGSKALRTAAKAIGALAIVPTLRISSKQPAISIRVDGEKPTAVRPATALVSGRALELNGTGFSNGFPWPFAAGRDDLLAWIEQSRAKEIFVTGASADAIVKKLGSKARSLGPPRQMALFAT